MEALPFNDGPADDGGATTSSKYWFQHCRAAARLLAALARGENLTVVCEHHEDYLVLDGSLQAVSVKSRDQTQTRWTMSALVGDGNLGHLFGTFRRADTPVACRFETNRAHSVRDLWSSVEQDRCDAREDLANRMGENYEDIDCFVDHLTIDDTLPHVRDIAYTYASNHAALALDALGIVKLDSFNAIELTTGLIATASRDKLMPDALAQLLLATPDELPGLFDRLKIEERIVDTEDVRLVLENAATALVPRIPAATRASAVPIPETTLTKKLERGGLGPSVISSAGKRRALWFAHRARHRDIPEREEELDAVQEWVQDQANAAENVARVQGKTLYGREMYGDLMSRLASAELLPEGTRLSDSSTALLQGAAFELTDACSVWWSDRFAITEPDEDR